MEERPRVSVVVPVYNCRASLERTFTSVFEQSLPPSQIEIIAVDDGSTDGGLQELRRLAADRPGFTVLHRPNSGGPGAPRNQGIERASGEYVFFLDADDYLGTEALERMCAMADENRTDVVVGQCVGINRRPPVFPRDVARTTLAESPHVYDTLSPLKLFRRSFLNEHGLRFVEGLASHEDQPFTSRAYFEADGISILAGYDCYYWVDREDGTSSLQTGGAPAEQYFPVIAEVMGQVAARVEAGPLRDRLMRRHFRYEVFSRFDARYLELPDMEKALTRVWGQKLVDAWYTDTIDAEFGPRGRLIAYCLRNDLDDVLDEVVPTWIDGARPPTVIDGGRAYMAFPRFRDPSVGIPDSCYDITDELGVRVRLTELAWRSGRLRFEGVAALAGVEDDDQEVTLVLRDDAGNERRFPAVRPAGGKPETFRAAIDFAAGAPLGAGTWGADVELRVKGLTKARRLTAEEDTDLPGPRLTGAAHTVVPRLAGKRRELRLRILGGRIDRLLTVDEVTWDGRRKVCVRARVPSILSGDHPVDVAAELVPRGGGAPVPATAGCRVLTGRLEVTAEFDLSGCRAGRWDPWLEITVGEATVRGRLPYPGSDPLPEATWFLGRAVPYRTRHGGLSFRISETGVAGRSRRIARRLLHR